MCTLCLSDMGELRDDWLREPRPVKATTVETRVPEVPVARDAAARHVGFEAVAA